MRTNPLRCVSILAVVVWFLPISGCATYRSIDSATFGTPKVYSGTRLDIAGLGWSGERHRFLVEPPIWPGLDLPLSFVGDTILLPLALPAAAYEAVFR